jgi:hypothetical protein
LKNQTYDIIQEIRIRYCNKKVDYNFFTDNCQSNSLEIIDYLKAKYRQQFQYGVKLNYKKISNDDVGIYIEE